MKKYIILLILAWLPMLQECTTPARETDSFPELSGPYLGQPLPDTIPELFAPGIVGTPMFTRDIAMTPDGNEIYFCVAIASYNYSTILYTKQKEGHWSKPAVVPFATDGKLIDFEPAITPDGSRLFFLSTRPDGDEEPGDQDIWYVERQGDSWGEPVNPGAPLNTDGGEFFPSLTSDGYIYFTHNDRGSGLNQIFRARIMDDTILPPELLPEQVNCGTNRFNAFVAQDHSYVIVPAMGMPDAYDQVDYYITFRKNNDHWSKPLNLGPGINKGNTRGWSAYVTPDGKYLFFMSNRSEEIPAAALTYDTLLYLYNHPGNGNAGIYWVKADFIRDLREKAQF